MEIHNEQCWDGRIKKPGNKYDILFGLTVLFFFENKGIVDFSGERNQSKKQEYQYKSKYYKAGAGIINNEKHSHEKKKSFHFPEYNN
jgi:hypothetical protein